MTVGSNPYVPDRGKSAVMNMSLGMICKIALCDSAEHVIDAD